MPPLPSPTPLPPLYSRIAPAILLILSTLPFAAVHDPAKLALAALTSALAIIGLLPAGNRAGPRAVALAYVALVLSLLTLVPWKGALLFILQPGLADHSFRVFSLLPLGTPPRPLALHVPDALTALALACALLPLSAAIARLPTEATRLLARGILLAGLLQCALAALHRLTHATSIFWVSGIPAYTRTDFFGSFVNPNHAGALLAVGVPLASSLPHPVAALTVALILSLGTLATGSRGALLALAAGVLTFSLRTGGRTARLASLLTGAVLGLIVLLIGPKRVAWWLSLSIIPEDHLQDLSGRRVEIWADTLDLIQRAPWLGVGPGGFADGFKLARTSPVFSLTSHAHNDLLQLLAEAGVLAGGLWIFVGGAALWQAARRPDRLSAAWLSASVALAVAAMVDFPLQIPALSLLGAILFGALLSGSTAAVPRLRGVGLGMAGLSGVLLGARLWVSHPDALTAQAEHPETSPQEAEALYTQALWLAPQTHRALLGLGGLRWKAGGLDEAAAIYGLAAAGYPTLPWPWLNLARLRRAQGDLEGAFAAWRQMLAQNLPNNDDARPWLAEALAVGDDPVLAARQSLPPRADRLRLGARMLTDRVDTPEARVAAEALYRQAVALDPESATAYAGALLSWDRPAEALAVLAGLPEERCSTARLAAKAHGALGAHDAARRRFAQAIRSCPEADRAGLERGLLCSEMMLGEAEALETAAGLLRGGGVDRDGLRHTLVAALIAEAGRGRLQRERLLDQLEILILEGDASMPEMETYSLVVAGHLPAVPDPGRGLRGGVCRW